MSNSGTTSFPNTLDSFAGLTTARKEDEAGYTHVALHNQDQAAITAIEKAVGTTSGTGVLKNFTSGDLAARIANETLGTPAISGGTVSAAVLANCTIGTPAISAGTTSGVVNKPTLTTDTDGATITLNMAASGIHTVVLGGNRVLEATNTAIGQPFIVRLKQDGTGERTVTWFAGITWKIGGTAVPTLSTAVNLADTFEFLTVDTDTYDGFLVGKES